MKVKVAFGGGCHWCTEAVFSVLMGVEKVEQGWVKSTAPNNSFSEAVIVEFDPEIISLNTLLKVHLETHASTSNHSMRNKYRSAVYYFHENGKNEIQSLLDQHAANDKKQYITKVLPFVAFKMNKENFLKYYEKNKEAPFSTTYIDPKLNMLKKNFSKILKQKLRKE